jgi:D-amino peptidase
MAKTGGIYMKVYRSFDIEGVTGIADTRDIEPGSAAFTEAMSLSTGDVNAAVEGALAGGATEVIVYDGHGWGRRNLLFEKLHPKAKLIRARVSSAGLNMAGFDESYDALFFVGWHSRASAPGVLSHCLNSKAFTAWRVNGREVGEPELAAALAGEFQVPLVLFTGDDRSCEEVKAWCPECELVVTKYALDRYTAICLSRDETYTLIKQGAERAMLRRKEIPPFTFQKPVRIEADTVNDHIAQAIAEIPGVKLIGPVTVCYESNDYREAFRATHAMQMISGLAA